MGRARGVGRRKQKKYKYNTSKKRLWQKMKKLPTITCAEMKQEWDEKKGLHQNFKEMGLSADPNKSLKVASWRDILEPMKIPESPGDLEMSEEVNEKDENVEIPKSHVSEALVERANEKKSSRFKLPNDIVKFCMYMMEKHGEDYQKMARDRKNYYQETPKKIKRLINDFKKSTNQYDAYLNLLKGEETSS